MWLLGIAAVFLTLSNLVLAGGLVMAMHKMSRPGASFNHRKHSVPKRERSGRSHSTQSATVVAPGVDYNGEAARKETKAEAARRKALQSMKVPVSAYRRADGTPVSKHKRTEEVRV